MKVDMTQDIDQYSNKNGYYVHHDPESNLYEIRSNRPGKNPQLGKFTTRVLATNALAAYLDAVTQYNQQVSERAKPWSRKKPQDKEKVNVDEEVSTTS